MKLKDFLRIGVALFAVMLCTACSDHYIIHLQACRMHLFQDLPREW